MKLNAKNFGIIPQNADKKITYNANLFITKGAESLKLSAIDDGSIYLKNNEKIIIKNSKILVERGNKAKSIVNLKGFVDSKYNYSVNLRAKNFQIPEVLSLLDTQIIENNIGEQLVYFKDISGNFDFDVSADNKNMNGSVKLNKLRFKLIPLMDLPILLTNGDVKFDNYKIDLKNFSFDCTSRFGLVWNNAHWFAGGSFISHLYAYRKNRLSLTNSVNFANIYVGFFFNRKKEYR